ncbi:MAG: YbjN domain-containing protein [Anaerolineaceae bacterium]|nr:YbjN domain-containing protein [Anaerolineaceae bacterium]
MGRILESIGKFLAADDWPHSLMDDRTVYKTGFEGKNGQFTCYAQERGEQDQFVFYSIFPVRVPAERMGEVAEFITRANYGMIIGNFELDYSDGEIRYKTSVDMEEVEVVEALVRHMIYANVLTMDKYFPGLMRVLYAGIAPADAVEEVEGGTE